MRIIRAMFTIFKFEGKKDRRAGQLSLSVAFVAISGLFLLGCGGNGASDPGSNTTSANRAADGSNINGAQVRTNVDPNEVNGSSTNVGDATQNEIATAQKALADRSDIVVTDPRNPDGSKGSRKPITRPAPDNSEYWSTLTDVAREFREFKKHPQIKKVEKTTDGKTSVVRIFTTSGKTVDVPGNTFPDISRVSVNDFIQAAGMTPIAPKAAPPGPEVVNPDKKKAEMETLGKP